MVVYMGGKDITGLPIGKSDQLTFFKVEFKFPLVAPFIDSMHEDHFVIVMVVVVMLGSSTWIGWYVETTSLWTM